MFDKIKINASDITSEQKKFAKIINKKFTENGEKLRSKATNKALEEIKENMRLYAPLTKMHKLHEELEPQISLINKKFEDFKEREISVDLTMETISENLLNKANKVDMETLKRSTDGFVDKKVFDTNINQINAELKKLQIFKEN